MYTVSLWSKETKAWFKVKKVSDLLDAEDFARKLSNTTKMVVGVFVETGLVSRFGVEH